MSRFGRLALALLLGTTAPGCSAELDAQLPGEVSSGDLCQLACERRALEGCVVDVAACSETCATARAAGFCASELELSLACVAGAEVVHCGRAPNGSSCDAEALALERCIATHAVPDTPPDCYGHECSWECGPIGQKLCTPDMSYLCECPAGGSGERRCSSDGCFLAPCACAE